MALGDVMRQWMAELGWNQVEMAQRAKGAIAQSQISDLVRGRQQSATGATLEALAAAFGIGVDQLLAAAARPPGEIPSIAEVLPPTLADLPGWARDFHRWGSRLSPREREQILALARTLAEEAAEREGPVVEAQAYTDPAAEQEREQGA